MGDLRFDTSFERLRLAEDRASALRQMPDEDIIGALASARANDPVLANVLATEASNRMRRTATIARVIAEAVFLATVDGRITYANPAAERLLARTAEDLTGRHLHSAMHGVGSRCPERPDCSLEKLLEPPWGPAEVPGFACLADGSAINVSFTVYPVEDPEGSLEGLVVVVRDVRRLVQAESLLQERIQLLQGAVRRSLEEINERKRAEEELRRSEERLSKIVDTIEEGIVILDPSGRMTFTNHATQRILESSSDILGKNFRDTAAWKDIASRGLGEGIEALLQRVFTEGDPIKDLEVDIPSGAGFRTLAVDVVPLRDSLGRISGALASLSDVTETKRAEARLKDANRDLERRVGERTEALRLAYEDLESFTRAVTHDLKAPLRGIQVLSQALEEDQTERLDDEGREVLRRMQNEVARLRRLVDDLLSLSKAARQEISREPVDVSRLATEAIERLHAWDPSRSVKVSIEPDIRVSADPKILSIVIENLVGNAWKYSNRKEEAHIEIGSRMEGKCRAIFVRDNGIGFEPQEADRLFKPFQRLRTARGFEGTGLGLATVHRIISQHGGRVWAEGRPDEGSTFWFTVEPEGEGP